MAFQPNIHQHYVGRGGGCEPFRLHGRGRGHAFRHIAAKLHLIRWPNDYLPISLMLGHKDIETTRKFYCELEMTSAARQYAENVLGSNSVSLKAGHEAGGHNVEESIRLAAVVLQAAAIIVTAVFAIIGLRA